MPDVTGDADYEALRRLADAYIRVARTPHYQQMAAAACDHARLQSAEAAQAARSSAAKAAFKATEAAHKQAREALRDSAAAASRQRIADAKAAIPHHRRVIVAAEALQPLIEQLTSRSTVWTTAVQRASGRTQTFSRWLAHGSKRRPIRKISTRNARLKHLSPRHCR